MCLWVGMRGWDGLCEEIKGGGKTRVEVDDGAYESECAEVGVSWLEILLSLSTGCEDTQFLQ
jgi:hypothetical protein